MNPEMIGPYRLEESIGEGGMGAVYRAYDPRLDRWVAIKRALPSRSDEASRKRFHREARLVAGLAHPAIVHLNDIITDDEAQDWIVMELVEGRTLEELTRHEPLELGRLLGIVRQVAEALAEAHAKGIIHRDLKTENVMVTSAGHAKVLDFGLAKELSGGLSQALYGSLPGQDSDTLTQTGEVVGTGRTMAPEQARGFKVDARTDLFALGVLIYEAVSGQRPFDGVSPIETLSRVCSRAQTPLIELDPTLPLALDALVEDLLRKDPAERPERAEAVVDALDDILELVRGPQTAREDLPSSDATLALRHPVSSIDGIDPGEQSVVRTLLVVELIDSTQLEEPPGDRRAARFFARHDRMARDLLPRFQGLEIDRDNGFLLLFERPFDAIGYALAYHQALTRLSATAPARDRQLEARAGVHLGVVLLRQSSPSDVARGARPFEVGGLAKTLATRVTALAGPRQTLLTRAAFDLARRAVHDEEPWGQDLVWLAHGNYLVEGVDEPLELFEVGAEGFAHLLPPPNSERARRVVAASDELVLGWRPAAGQTIPRRPNWVLEERLGAGGFGEVWQVRHTAQGGASGEERVFKFCLEAERLRALRREVTLFQLLREALGHRDDIARVLDWNFDSAPFFVESEYSQGGDLKQWAARQGGLATVPLATRLELVAQVAEALGAAHSVGVLHKDVKPENILIVPSADGPSIRLCDFGVGALLDRSHLEALDLTARGFTETLAEDDSTAGSRRYMAPELLEGKPVSVQSDLYSVGVLLFQVVVGDFSRSLASGWRREVEDELLADDIARLVDGSPRRRPEGAASVAKGLRALEARREEQEASRRAERWRKHRRLGIAFGATALVVSTLFTLQARRLRAKADTAREQAEELVSFMLGDLQTQLRAGGRLDGLDGAGRKVLEYFEGLDPDELDSRTVARHAKALHQLGDVRMAQGRLDEAQVFFRQAVTQTRVLVERDPDDREALFELGQGRFWVGNVFFEQGDLQAALVEMRAYLETSQALHALDPDDDALLMEVADGHNNVGALLVGLGNSALAHEHYIAALETSRQLVDRDPTDTYLRRQLVDAQLRIGQMHESEGELVDAKSAYTDAVATALALYEQEPADTEAATALSLAYDYLGNAAQALGELDEEHRLRALQLEILGALCEAEPAQVDWGDLLASARYKMAGVLTWRGETEEPLALLRLAIDWHEGLVRQGVERTQDDQQLANLRIAVAEVHLLRGNLVAARETAERVLVIDDRLWREDFDARWILGKVAQHEGNPRDAHALFLKGLEIARANAAPRDHRALSRLARALLTLGELDAAKSPVYKLLGMGYAHPRLLVECGATAPQLCPESMTQ